MYTKILTLVDCSANSVENGEVQKHREFKSLKDFIADFIGRNSYKQLLHTPQEPRELMYNDIRVAK